MKLKLRRKGTLRVIQLTEDVINLVVPKKFSEKGFFFVNETGHVNQGDNDIRAYNNKPPMI